jgi:hypothetical protein
MIPEEEALIVHGPGRARFVWPYWLSDPAYLLRMEWRPGPSAWLPPDDEWWLRGVRVPEMEGVTLLAGESMLHGRRAQALALVGEHATLPGREHDVMGLTTLEISMDGTLPEGLRFTVMDAVDDRGRRVPVQEVVVGRSIGLVLKPSARTVDIRLGVYRRIRAEWCVAPRLVTGGTK